MEIQDVHPMKRIFFLQNIVWQFDDEDVIPSSSSKDRSILNKTPPKKLTKTHNYITPLYAKILRDFNYF
jgi:hypothetical protein